jgi:cell fate regulator YaaT (PSP1 superfamily)
VEPHARPCVSVRFGPAGRTQTFLLAEPLEPHLRIGESLVVQTPDGPTIGQVHPHPEALEARRSDAAVPAVPVRRVTAADLAERFTRDNREREGRAYAMDRIRAHKLAMKLSRVEATLDGSRLIVYFTADDRIDFRELVKELAGRFRTRIEMRQIGVRDEARLLGGYGSCGRPLCCTTWLTSFEPVSIRMAKQQDLALNPSKLSGLCGRLKCCLRYELPNAKGVVRGGCGDEGGCNNPTGCGTGGGCGTGSGCGSCGTK